MIVYPDADLRQLTGTHSEALKKGRGNSNINLGNSPDEVADIDGLS